MRIGLAFPHSEIGNDPVRIRDFAQAAEELGYDHISAIDHTLGARVAAPEPPWAGHYTIDKAFHEPFVLFGFMAAATRRIGLATAVLILPQRPTVLVAKQAAEIDVLSGGRLRLGVGIGWNEMEYVANGQNFRNRASRIVEQVELMRRLWTEPTLDYEGRWHRIDDAGINPLPVQRPIPIWIGAFVDAALERGARISEGWFTNPRMGCDADGAATIERMRGYVRAAGRDPDAFGINGIVHSGKVDPDRWTRETEWWRAQKVSHISFRTIGAPYATFDEHMSAIRRYAEDHLRG